MCIFKLLVASAYRTKIRLCSITMQKTTVIMVYILSNLVSTYKNINLFLYNISYILIKYLRATSASATLTTRNLFQI